MITYYIIARVSALIFLVKTAGSSASYLLRIHFSFDVSVDQVFYFAFLLLFLKANFAFTYALYIYSTSGP